jgi:hypothetical protein
LRQQLFFDFFALLYHFGRAGFARVQCYPEVKCRKRPPDVKELMLISRFAPICGGATTRTVSNLRTKTMLSWKDFVAASSRQLDDVHIARCKITLVVNLVVGDATTRNVRLSKLQLVLI